MQASLAPAVAAVKGHYMAAIDLGSNSFHIMVAEFRQGQMVPLQCWGEKVQLADGLIRHGRLGSAAKQRAFACLQRFAEAIAEVPPDQVRVVGTDALRRADDSLAFIGQAESLLGVPVEIISGQQEAHLIYRGVIHGQRDRGNALAEPLLVVDIGGGSTELVLGQGDRIVHSASLPLGCVSYSQRFFPGQCSDQRQFETALEQLQATLAPCRERFAAPRWEQAIGTAGTALAIESVLLAKGWGSGGISRPALARLASLLCQGQSVASLQLPGLSETRFDIVTAGVAIMLAVFEVLGIEQLQTSQDSLREGMLYDMLAELPG